MFTTPPAIKSWFVVLLLLPSVVLSDDTEQIQQLKSIRQELQHKTLSLLVLLKQIDGSASATPQQRVKVIKPIATIRETDNTASQAVVVARLNDEFPVLEQRDEWYHVRLPDRREGWIHETMVQALAGQAIASAPSQSSQFLPDVETSLALAADLVNEINAKYDSAQTILTRLEENNQQLPEEKRSELAQEREKIREYHVYANHFYEKYAANQERPRVPTVQIPRAINGQLSVQSGKSAYESAGEESLTARDINFSGTMQLSDLSQFIASLTNRREVIQTPYSTNDVRVGYNYQAPQGVNFTSYAAYNGYDDKALERNTFKNLGGGFGLRYPLSSSSLFFSEINYENKDYEEEGSNSYQGGQFNLGLRRQSSSNSQLTMNLQGLIQSSDISFLDFTRLMPQVRYLRRSQGGTFGANFEVERIGYAEEAKGNDFLRERINLDWSKNGRQRQLSITGKQFPNNKEQGYIKLGGQMNWQKLSLSNQKRTGLYALLAFFPQGGDITSDYLDLRLDRYTSGNRFYHELSVFGRAWRKTDADAGRDHVLDLYGRWGVKLQQLEVGPLIGAHLLLNKGERVIKRDGNSLRAGLDATGNFAISPITINLGFRYERDFVFGSQIAIDPNTGQTTLGEVETRRPWTLQVSTGLRAPIGQDFEFRLDINRYKIKLDVDQETSINPIASRSRTVIMAGFGYRFGVNYR